MSDSASPDSIPTTPVLPAPQPEYAAPAEQPAPAKKKRGGLIAAVTAGGLIVILAAFGGGVALGTHLDRGFGLVQSTDGRFGPGDRPGFDDRAPGGPGDRPGAPGGQDDQSGTDGDSDS